MTGHPTTDEILWLYRLLLGRDPEATAIDHAATQPSVQDLRRAIMRSDEFQAGFAGLAAPADDDRYAFCDGGDLQGDMVWHSKLSLKAIQLCYRAVLERNVESDGVAQRYAARNLDLFTLVSELLGSIEKRKAYEKVLLEKQFLRRAGEQPAIAGQSRVLLFGAYGNGNVGDQCQADAVSGIVNHLTGDDGSVSISAASWEAVALPNLRNAALRPHDEILDASALRAYDLLLIGGGGILSTPHFPLHSRAWVAGLQMLNLRYGFVGVGASAEELQAPDRAEAYGRLLKGAAFVSARDEESLHAVRLIRPDAAFMPDPHLVSKALQGRVTSARRKAPHVVLIPKTPVDRKEEAAVEALSLLQRDLTLKGVKTTTLFLEPHVDARIADLFTNIVQADTVQIAEACIEQASAIYSMRYHGAIFALSRRISCWGIGAKKIVMLYDRIGIPDFIIPSDELARNDPPAFEYGTWAMVDTFFNEASEIPDAVREGITSRPVPARTGLLSEALREIVL